MHCSIASTCLPIPALALLALSATAQNIGQNGTTELVSRDHLGQVVANSSFYPSLSEDGRYLAFQSSSALLPEDTNGSADIFILDRQDGSLTLGSTTAGGAQGNGGSYSPYLSADGRWLVFQSAATNFAALDTNGDLDVFRKDLLTGAIDRVSNAHLSTAAANSSSLDASISDDGRYVAFESIASDLVASDTNFEEDIFVRDMQTGQVWRVSEGVWGESNHGSHSPHISGDGSRVVYHSYASNLVLFDNNNKSDVFVVTPGFNPTRLTAGNGNSYRPTIAADGAWVAFESLAEDLVPEDTNGFRDVFLVEVASGAIQLMSVTESGLQNPANSSEAVIARDSGAVVFQSKAALAPVSSWSQDLVVRDLDAGTIVNVSLPDGVTNVADDDSFYPALAQGGEVVAFASDATNLAADDTNGVTDIFIRTTIPDAYVYGTPSTTTHGCQPILSTVGYPSPTSGQPFMIVGDDLPNQKAGLFFYGFSGQSSNPWGNGTMYVAGSKKRTPLMNSFGTPPPADDCTGGVALDMNLFASGALGGSPKPALSVPGQMVNVQYWGRDPEAASGTFLSDAVEYVVGP